jgi:hypothetical protein
MSVKAAQIPYVDDHHRGRMVPSFYPLLCFSVLTAREEDVANHGLMWTAEGLNWEISTAHFSPITSQFQHNYLIRVLNTKIVRN